MTLLSEKFIDCDDSGYPKDWHQDITAHGVCRHKVSRRYVAKMSVGGVQVTLGSTTSQAKAATLYDLGLWKLAAVLGRVLKPNNRESFLTFTQADVDTNCPKLNALYNERAALKGFKDDITERERREAALVAPVDVVVESKTDRTMWAYDALASTVAKHRAANFKTDLALMKQRPCVNLTKLPGLQEQLDTLAELVTLTEACVSKLGISLSSHRPYVEKLLREGTLTN